MSNNTCSFLFCINKTNGFSSRSSCLSYMFLFHVRKAKIWSYYTIQWIWASGKALRSISPSSGNSLHLYSLDTTCFCCSSHMNCTHSTVQKDISSITIHIRYSCNQPDKAGRKISQEERGKMEHFLGGLWWSKAPLNAKPLTNMLKSWSISWAMF